MIKNLKKIVIFLGIIVLLLFSITIVSLIYKFKNRDIINIENLELVPKLKSDTVVNSFQIKGKKIYLNIKERSGKQFIRIYDLDSGKELGKINLSK